MRAIGHPPPPALHGLLTLKPSGAFSKRVRRFAYLEEGVLMLRRNHHDESPDFSQSLAGAVVKTDVTSLSIVIQFPQQRRLLRLFALSSTKFSLWASAISASAQWTLLAHYTLLPNLHHHHHSNHPLLPAVDNKTKRRVLVRGVPHVGYMRVLADREATICRIIHHSNLSTILDVFRTPTLTQIVMQRPQHTLQCVLSPYGPLPERLCAHVMKQVFKGIAYLHARNIVHRDISPNSIAIPDCLVSADCVQQLKDEQFCKVVHPVQIADFVVATFVKRRPDPSPDFADHPDNRFRRPTRGTALVERGRACDCAHAEDDPEEGGLERMARGFTQVMWLDDEAQTREEEDDEEEEEEEDDEDGLEIGEQGHGIEGLTVTEAIGAASYAAPEVVRGRGYGTPADVWGCGVLLHYMLCGRMPVERREARDVVEGVGRWGEEGEEGEKEGVWERSCWDGVSKEARSLVKALLIAEPRRRLTAEAALRNEWMTANCVCGDEGDQEKMDVML